MSSRPCSRCQPRANSDSYSHAMFWKSKLGVLVAVTGICAIVLVTSSGLILSGVARLSSYEGTLRELENEVRNKSNQDVTTPKPTSAPPGTSPGAPIATCPDTDDKDKFDCQPEANATEAKCMERGCCWKETPQTPPSYGDPAPVNVPQCFFPADYNGYKAVKVENRSDGLRIILARQYPSGMHADEAMLEVQVTHYNYKTARITIKSALNERWVPPIPPIAEQSTERDVGYSVELDETKKRLSVYRLRDLDKEETPVFSINLSTLIFADQYIQISSALPSAEVYGLGDMKGPLRHSVDWTRRTLFNKDHPPRYNRSLYGAHSFMMSFDKRNLANGVYLKNSNAMDVILQPQPAITFRTIGGILDFFVFVGPTPNDVFSQYQKLIGLPAMVPYWSLGFHLCRYGIGTLENTIAVYERNVKAKVPLEVQWNDIDYMDDFNMFTYSTQNFSGLPEFIERVHNDSRKYVMIFDPAVSGSEKPGTYPPYDRGVEMDIFVKDINNKIVPYKVWNLQTSIFPDFSNPRTDQYWKEMFEDFYHRQNLHFDGAWIDMNEPSNQKNGTLENTCPQTLLDFPPIEIGGERLFTFTACMSDRLHMSNFYDVHNLYPHLEARATYKALTAIRPNKRPFIISRSSSSGQGLWSGHWTGDIDSTWPDMRQSVTDLINYAMFGMPMLGADICGFQYDTTPELCARWQALGAFYPFSRNHNDRLQKRGNPSDSLGGWFETGDKITFHGDRIDSQENNYPMSVVTKRERLGVELRPLSQLEMATVLAIGALNPETLRYISASIDQDPAFLKGDVLNATITTLNKKYLFAPYLYTLLYRAHAEGETVFRAMMFNFPTDIVTHDIDDQFMWGEGLLIAPALEQGQDSVQPYLPAGVWYHYNDDGKQYVITSGERKNFSAPINDINLLMRGGNIIPAQDISGNNLSGNRQNGFILFVAPDVQRSAKGQLFWDDGETLDTYEKGEYSLVNFLYSHNSITISPEKTGYIDEPTKLETINVLGVDAQPKNLWINGKEIIDAQMPYVKDSKLLIIANLSIQMLDAPVSIVFI